MQRTVNQGFRELLERIVPTYAESAAAEKNASVIERRLKTEFDMSYMATFGSTGHGTHIKGHSAVDCFAVIPKAHLFADSGKSLIKIRFSVSKDFPAAGVTGGRPVVAVPFGEGPAERHHIVPAFPKGKKGEYDVYGIPAPRDRWVSACPGAHSTWLNGLDAELDRKLKPLVRLVKAWNIYNGEPLWPFYIELCMAEYLQQESSVVYSVDLKNFFRYVALKRLAPFEGSEGCDEPVYGTSRADKDEAIAKLVSAAEMTDTARECEIKGDIENAYFWWRKVFKYKFSTY
ncbi:MAG: SMODS domain-containing nucleotidyltransferase [Hyphomicrobiales bacterium]